MCCRLGALVLVCTGLTARLCAAAVASVKSTEKTRRNPEEMASRLGVGFVWFIIGAT